MSIFDASYQNYVNENYDPDDEPAHECAECEALLNSKPDWFIEVRDKVLSWEDIPVGDGEMHHAPAEWSYITEPVFTCSECGHDN